MNNKYIELTKTNSKEKVLIAISAIESIETGDIDPNMSFVHTISQTYSVIESYNEIIRILEQMIRGY